jgi:hypothetical protein
MMLCRLGRQSVGVTCKLNLLRQLSCWLAVFLICVACAVLVIVTDGQVMVTCHSVAFLCAERLFLADCFAAVPYMLHSAMFMALAMAMAMA